jgi:hypothetical protein
MSFRLMSQDMLLCCKLFTFKHPMSSSVHNHSTYYCSVQKRTFAPQGWKHHVQACEKNLVIKQLDKKQARVRRLMLQETSTVPHEASPDAPGLAHGMSDLGMVYLKSHYNRIPDILIIS